MKSKVLARLFDGSFREGASAHVELPEEPDVVEAVLQHIYTGELPASVDPVQALQLAHRLDLPDCVVACSSAVDNSPVADAARVLASLLDDRDPAVRAAWARLKRRVRNDDALLDTVLRRVA